MATTACVSCNGPLGSVTYRGRQTGGAYCDFCGFTRREAMGNPRLDLQGLLARFRAKFHRNPTKEQARRIADWHRARSSRARVIEAKRVKGGHVALKDAKKGTIGVPKSDARAKKEGIKARGGYARVLPVKGGFAVYSSTGRLVGTVHPTREAAKAAYLARKKAVAPPAPKVEEKPGAPAPAVRPVTPRKARAPPAEKPRAPAPVVPAAPPPPGLPPAPTPPEDEAAIEAALLAEMGAAEAPAPAASVAKGALTPAEMRDALDAYEGAGPAYVGPVKGTREMDKPTKKGGGPSDEVLLAALEEEFGAMKRQQGTAQNPGYDLTALQRAYDEAKQAYHEAERAYHKAGRLLTDALGAQRYWEYRAKTGTAQNPGVPLPLTASARELAGGPFSVVYAALRKRGYPDWWALALAEQVERTAQNPHRGDRMCSCGHWDYRHGRLQGASSSVGCRDCVCERWEGTAQNPKWACGRCDERFVDSRCPMHGAQEYHGTAPSPHDSRIPPGARADHTHNIRMRLGSTECGAATPGGAACTAPPGHPGAHQNPARKEHHGGAFYVTSPEAEAPEEGPFATVQEAAARAEALAREKGAAFEVWQDERLVQTHFPTGAPELARPRK